MKLAIGRAHQWRRQSACWRPTYISWRPIAEMSMTARTWHVRSSKSYRWTGRFSRSHDEGFTSISAASSGLEKIWGRQMSPWSARLGSRHRRAFVASLSWRVNSSSRRANARAYWYFLGRSPAAGPCRKSKSAFEVSTMKPCRKINYIVS